MKRILLIFMVLLFAGTSFAQTQQGIVKTPGRMVHGKLLSGDPLPGATITLKDWGSYVSQSDGQFSFSVPTSMTFTLDRVEKKNYKLIDLDLLRKPSRYSAQSPFCILMLDENQYMAELNAARNEIKVRLESQLQKREEEINQLRLLQKITEEEYQRQISELRDQEDQAHTKVRQLAERYVATDYDAITEFNRQVLYLIEQGELLKADSLIRSKGDFDERENEYRKDCDALKSDEETLEEAKKAVRMKYEDLASDYKNFYELHMRESQMDSARYYLKRRADLDSTNVEATYDYFEFARDFSYRKDAEEYGLRFLDIADEVTAAVYASDVALLLSNKRQAANLCKKYIDMLDERILCTESLADNIRKDLYIIMADYGDNKDRIINLNKALQYYRPDYLLGNNDLIAIHKKFAEVYSSWSGHREEAEPHIAFVVADDLYTLKKSEKKIDRSTIVAKFRLGANYRQFKKYNLAEKYLKETICDILKIYNPDSLFYKQYLDRAISKLIDEKLLSADDSLEKEVLTILSKYVSQNKDLLEYMTDLEVAIGKKSAKSGNVGDFTSNEEKAELMKDAISHFNKAQEYIYPLWEKKSEVYKFKYANAIYYAAIYSKDLSLYVKGEEKELYLKFFEEQIYKAYGILGGEKDCYIGSKIGDKIIEIKLKTKDVSDIYEQYTNEFPPSYLNEGNILDTISTHDIATAIALCRDIASDYYKEMQYEKALHYSKKAFVYVEEKLKTDHQPYFQRRKELILQDLAICFYRLSRLEEYKEYNTAFVNGRDKNKSVNELFFNYIDNIVDTEYRKTGNVSDNILDAWLSCSRAPSFSRYCTIKCSNEIENIEKAKHIADSLWNEFPEIRADFTTPQSLLLHSLREVVAPSCSMGKNYKYRILCDYIMYFTNDSIIVDELMTQKWNVILSGMIWNNEYPLLQQEWKRYAESFPNPIQKYKEIARFVGQKIKNSKLLLFEAFESFNVDEQIYNDQWDKLAKLVMKLSSSQDNDIDKTSVDKAKTALINYMTSHLYYSGHMDKKFYQSIIKRLEIARELGYDNELADLNIACHLVAIHEYKKAKSIYNKYKSTTSHRRELEILEELLYSRDII